MTASNKLIYFASPYTSYPYGRKEAFDLVCLKAGELMLQGHKIFCPIAHSHSIEQYMPKIMSGDWWLDQDFAVLRMCDEVWVYTMPGWKESYGISKEVAKANELRIPVKYIEYEPITDHRIAA